MSVPSLSLSPSLSHTHARTLYRSNSIQSNPTPSQLPIGVLLLNGNGLTGTIPPSLGNLVLLENIGLQLNNLNGTLPSELGNLINLVELRLFGNSLSGTVPPELGNLVRLRRLHLRRNSLTGQLPSELGNLVLLRDFTMGTNDLTGIVPTELCAIQSLTTLVADCAVDCSCCSSCV